MLLAFNRKNVGPMEDKKLTFGSHINVFTGDNSLGKSFLLDLLWFGLTRIWPANLNRRLSQGLPARPRDISSNDSRLEYVFCPPGKKQGKPLVFRFNKESMLWKAGKGGPHKAGLVIYSMTDGGYAIWDPIQNYSADENDLREFPAFVLSPSELWPAPPKRDGSTELVEKSSFCNGVLKDWAKWQGSTKDQDLFELLKTAVMGLTPEGDIVGFPELADADTTSGDDQPMLRFRYGDVLLMHASSSIRRVTALAYVLVWAISQHAKAAKYRGLKPTDQIIFIADEIETHLHPRWQRSVMGGLIKTLNNLCVKEGFGRPAIQMFLSTHSPLVMAALEDFFYSGQVELPFVGNENDGRNKWFDLDLDINTGKVGIKEKDFKAQGRAEGWLNSEAFDVHSTYSPEIEKLIKEINDILSDWEGAVIRSNAAHCDLVADVNLKLDELSSRLPPGDWQVYALEHRLKQLSSKETLV